MNPLVQAFFDDVTGTVSYVVYDKPGGRVAVIDPVLDYDPKSGRTQTTSADELIRFVRGGSLTVDWILETHAHADHLSAARYLKQHLGGRIAIGERIREVQSEFKRLFNLGIEFPQDGSQFDHLFADDETFRVGQLTGRALHVPGHTPADMAYQLGNAVFVGDTLFMPDAGTARGGNAHALYHSIQRLLSLLPSTRLFMCHDYPPANRNPAWESTVAEQRQHNIHIHAGISEDEFVTMRNARDAGLEMPVLILPSVQINIRAGAMPPPESNGVSYLKVPVNAL